MAVNFIINSERLIIGVDVGGTNTDAVLLDPTKSGPDAVVSSYKAITGTDVTTGIEEAIQTLLKDAHLSPSIATSLMIGTTHFINAIVERDVSRLDPVAVIRLAGGSYMEHTPPFIDFPPALSRIIHGYSARISGGVQIDGAEIAPIKEDEILKQAAIIKEKGLRQVAVIGIYSPFDEKYRQEDVVRDILQRALGDDVDIVCSKDVAGVGILARENATVLNASILRFARRTIKGFKRAMKRLNLTCPLYLTSNSGQLLSSKEAMSFPIRVFSSGATNSIRGASFLAAKHELKESRYVIDIGGTTTDIGCLFPSGFPRLASATTEIGGVRVNFPMPQVESIGLGGGSLIHGTEGKVTIGPDSVGQALRGKAKCFGGDSLTATDIMVANGDARIGTIVPTVILDTISATKSKIKHMLEDHIDRMKTSPEPCHLLLVGGGAFLCPPTLQGVASIKIPAHADVANAVGAAVAEIGEEAEMIVDASKKDSTLADVKARAIAQAIARGAKSDQIRIIEEEVSGIPYIEGKFKISVKVVGPVDYERFSHEEMEVGDDVGTVADEIYHEVKELNANTISDDTVVESIDHDTYRPLIDKDRFWHASETDAYYISIGCYILGCAGGGTPYGSWLTTRQHLREGGKIKITDIGDLPEGAVVGPVAAMGSPIIAIERLGGDLIYDAMKGMEEHIGRKFTAVMTAEIGGSNGMAPLLLSSSKYFDIPCVDADLMGRAFPSFEMSSLFIGATDINHLLPTSLSSGDGTNMTLTSAKDVSSVDKVLRAACITMGLAAGISARPCTKAELQAFGIPKSLSLSWRLGRAVVRARAKGAISTVHHELIQEFGGPQTAMKIFEGKIVGVGQSIHKGHSYGNLVIEKLKDYEKEGYDDVVDYGLEKITIPFMNENLMVEAFYASGEKKILATVPDLIMVLDALTGEAVGVPEYRYGLKVMVLIAAAHPLWTSKRGLEIAGPQAFGYDIEFQPCGVYTPVRSVIDEFATQRES